MNTEFDTPTAGPVWRSHLTEAQRRILDHILLRTYEIAVREAAVELEDPANYVLKQFERRPRHVFHIDGSRGSGKTTLLLTARAHMQHLGCDHVLAHQSSIPFEINAAFDKIASTYEPSYQSLPSSLQAANLFKASHRDSKGGFKRTVLAFPALFPSDLDDAQPIMEGLFAFMEQELAREIDFCSSSNKNEIQSEREARVAEGKKLQRELHAQVTKSWFLSKQEGIEAILRDSHTYEKFLENRGRASGQSYRRVGDWRSYVNRYLDYFRAQLLAVFIDDTDVIPDVSTDILHTLRIFLDHPRIVTIVAGNLRTLRQTLVWRGMSDVRTSMQALSSNEAPTAFEWRRFLRRQIEEYLDKIIPRQQRQFLALKKFAAPDAESEETTDFALFAPSPSLAAYCKTQINASLRLFYETKLKTHKNYMNSKRELQSPNDSVTLEHLLSWWLLRHWYMDKLGPRTPRELKTLVSYTTKGSFFKRHEGSHAKRLAVIFFENAENYELVHRLEDGDSRVHDWLSRQELSSEWVGNKSFFINGRKIPEGTYSYNYICYRLDLGIALPLRENTENDIPKTLLPRPAGRNLTERLPFFPIDWQPKTTPLLDALNHSVMPANCMNMYDLQCLPDVAWRRRDTDHPWRPSLIYKWSEVFDLLGPRLRTRAIGGSNKAIEAVEQQERIEHYFFDIVIPMATLDVGRYVRTPERPMKAEEYGKDDLLLWHDTAPEAEFFAKDRAWLDDLRRRTDYLSQNETAQQKAADRRRPYRDSLSRDLNVFTDASRAKESRGILKHLVDYQWLLNDVRRAWHAARIFINHIGEFVEHEAAEQNRPPIHTIKRNFFSRSDRYRVVSLISLLDEINRLPPFNEFWEKATVDAGNHVKAVRGLSQEKDAVLWEHVDPARFIDMLGASDSTRKRTAKPRAIDLRSVTNGLLDVTSVDGNPFLFSGHLEGFGDARLSRVLFFLVVGLGPCFPAMIHIDFAGTFYDRNQEDTAGIVQQRLEDWERQLEKLQIFCFRYRASLERFVLRLEYLEGKDQETFEKHIWGSAVPDWSFSSLGIEGRQGMRRRPWGGLEARSDLKDLLAGISPADKKSTGSQPSLFRDAEGYLNNAQRYLSLIRQVAETRIQGQSTAKL